VAAALRRQPGFVWLDGGPKAGHRLYARPLLRFAAADGRVSAAGAGRTRRWPGTGFELLAAAFSAWGGEAAEVGGLELAGFLAYELGGELERLPDPPERDFPFPDLHLGLYDQVLLFGPGGWSLAEAPGWRPAAAEFDLERAVGAALAGGGGPPERPPSTSGRARVPRTVSRPDGAGYRSLVRRAVGRIAEGDLFQINLCRRLESEVPARDLWDLYLRLRTVSPADHGAWLAPGRGRAVLSISPETFLRVRGRAVETEPIKGTRPRGTDEAADRQAVLDLLGSEKDRAELTMIVDVARNDLGRVCETGSVEVPEHGGLMTLPTVHHTVSRVRGRLRPGAGAVELLRAAFPPASISGAPKIRALRRVAEMEPRRRGCAMGAIGWLALDGDLELSVAIRTAVAAGGRIAYHAGCGIVADSLADDELAESTAKARAFLSALGARETE
jgi:para-aminobenzoate synthetase component 1